MSSISRPPTSPPSDLGGPSLLSRKSVIAFIGAAILTFTSLFAVFEVARSESPHLRFGNTGGRISALVVTPGARLIILNSSDRSEIRAFTGRSARPWEPKPATVLVPASAEMSNGLWEYLQIATPEQVVVAGIPGAHPTWEAIVDLCAARNIDLTFVHSSARLMMDPFVITVFASDERSTGSVAVVRRQFVNTVIQLDGAALPGLAGQIFVGEALVAETYQARAVITTASDRDIDQTMQLVIQSRNIARIYVDEDQFRIRDVKVVD